MYVIEDELHSETIGTFPTFEQALAELHRLASLPWNEPPNLAPCTNWENAVATTNYSNTTPPNNQTPPNPHPSSKNLSNWHHLGFRIRAELKIPSESQPDEKGEAKGQNALGAFRIDPFEGRGTLVLNVNIPWLTLFSFPWDST